MAFLVVVKREEPDLFDYLQRHFQDPDVQARVLPLRPAWSADRQGSTRAFRRWRAGGLSVLLGVALVWDVGA